MVLYDYENRNKEILSLEALKCEINKNKYIYNKSTIDFMFSLLNLETSVFNKQNLKYTNNYNLSSSDLFKKLALYNCYNEILRFVDNYDEYCAYSTNFNSLKIYSNSDDLYLKVCPLAIFDYSCDLFDLEFYDKHIVPFEIQKQNNENALENKRRELLKLKNSCLNKKISIDSLEKEIQYLLDNRDNYSELCERINNEILVSEKSREVLDLFLENNYLYKDSDFVKQKNPDSSKKYVKSYGFGNIIIDCGK